jgi:prevent-host-death family protein
MYIEVYIPGMPQRYSLAEARASLPAIIDQAEAGQVVELTRRGKPVAVILSFQELERLRGERHHFRDAYRAFLEHHPVAQVGTEPDFAASLRDKNAGRRVAL